MKSNEIVITPKEFYEFEEKKSRAIKHEWLFSIDPIFRKYNCEGLLFLSQDVFPTYRVSRSTKELTNKYEDKEANPITFW